MRTKTRKDSCKYTPTCLSVHVHTSRVCCAVKRTLRALRARTAWIASTTFIPRQLYTAVVRIYPNRFRIHAFSPPTTNPRTLRKTHRSGKTLNEEDTKRLAELVAANKERKHLAEEEAKRIAEEEARKVREAEAEKARLAAVEAERVAAAIEAKRQAAATSIQRIVRGFVGWCRARDRRVARAADALRSSVTALLRLGVGGPATVALCALTAAEGGKTTEPPAGGALKAKHFSPAKQFKAVKIPATGTSGVPNMALLATCTGAHETATHFST